MREIIRGVIVAFVALALLAGCLLLIAGVGLWRITREDARVPGQHVRAAGTAPAQSNGPKSATAPAEASASASAEAAPLPARERSHSSASINIADAAGDHTKSPHLAPVAPLAPVAASARASLLRVDNDSAGGWVGRYGKKGYSVAMAGEPASLPAGVALSMNGSHLYLWSPVTTDRRGLSIPADPSRLSAAQWFSWEQFSLDLDLRPRGDDLQVALYLLDWDSDARAQRLEVTDGETGAVLLSRTDEHFRKGRYLLLRLYGHVKLRFTKTAGANCTLSGVFFDDPPDAKR